MRYFGMPVSSQFWGRGESPTSELSAQGPSQLDEANALAKTERPHDQAREKGRWPVVTDPAPAPQEKDIL
ncbi:MAG TPA: hypothetical protein VE270_07715, partial [Thermoleophilaceae bacterium]|nr:hypothetical protein [Thermoleophilaceae bacterium]